MIVEFRDAREEDADALGDIAVRSKGYWGYSHEALEVWRPAMMIAPAYIRTHAVQCVITRGRLVGFYAIRRDDCCLDHLWLLPEAIGRGIGRSVFGHVVTKTRELGLRSFHIVSDPHAAGFYLRMGAQQVGEVYSPHQNRLLPKLLFTLSAESRADMKDNVNSAQVAEPTPSSDQR